MSTFTSLANITRRLAQLSFRTVDRHNKTLLETAVHPRPMVTSTKMTTMTMPTTTNQSLSCSMSMTSFFPKSIANVSRSFTSSTVLAKENVPPETSESDKQWNNWQQSLLNNFLDNDSSSNALTKKRGGKTLRKKRAMIDEVSRSSSSQERLIDAGPGQFPPLRYSDEETERLLKEAYENIPVRTGKRGTRSFKRQKVRFIKIRKARSIKKMEKVRHHFDRMEKRSAKVKAIQKMKEIAVETREEDRLYQESVLKKWAAMNGVAIKSSSSSSSSSIAM